MGVDPIFDNVTAPQAAEYHADHFGYQRVGAEEKRAKVLGVFDQVASRYDLMNDLMSAGLHHHWKDRLIDTLRPTASMHLLDVAGGTGDIAFRFLNAGGGHVTIADLSEEMLRVGKGRAIDRNLDMQLLDWLHANAESLPCETSSFDTYTISFGIRNVTHLDRCLAESYRVLKPGGRFLCLEFSMPTRQWLKRLYDAYSFGLIPKVGRVVADDEASYQYLVESIRQFPHPKLFTSMMQEAGFEQVRERSMTGGVVTLYSGWKL